MKRFMMMLLVLGVVSFAAGDAMAKGGHGHHGRHGHHGHRDHHKHRGYYPKQFRTHTNFYRTRGYGYYPQPRCYAYPAYPQGVGYRGNSLSFWFGF